MASLKQRGGKYYAQFYDKSGKQCRISTGIDVTPKDGGKPALNRKRAQQAADLIERRAKGETAGTEVAAALRALAAMADDAPALTVREYLSNYRPSGKEQNQNNARRAISLFLDFLAARKLDLIGLAEVKPKTCEAFLGEMLQSVTVGTVGVYRNHLTAAFNRAMREELTEKNPFALTRMAEVVNQYAPETKGQDKAEREPFTAEEMRLILTEFPQPYRDLAAVSFFAGGQRIGDCIALTWGQVDFERGLIHFRTQKTAKRISAPLLPELRRRLEARRALSTDKAEPRVFPELARQAERCRGVISTAFTSLLRAHGILQDDAAAVKKGKRRNVSPKSFHSIRHAAVSLMRERGVPADVSRAVVGHDSEAVERVYFTASADARAEALSKLAEAVQPEA